MREAFTAALGAALTLVCGMSAARPRYVTYEQYGAKGDGVTDDMPAIVRAHNAANDKALPVRARDKATYYIGGRDLTAVIRTDTDWGKARFIVDDRAVEKRTSPIFRVESAQAGFQVTGVETLRKGQQNIGVSLPSRCLVSAEDDSRRVYIRAGSNRDNGDPVQEVFIADKDGTVSPNSSILWDYDRLTSLRAYPIDSVTLTVRGGIFTTYANAAPSLYNYYLRGIQVCRSNVVVEGLTHYVEGEPEDHGAPYSFFLGVETAAEVIVRDCVFTPHRIYPTMGSAGYPTRMGSYDLLAEHCVDLTYTGCTQTVSIDNTFFWGIFGSNYCKDIKMDKCVLSRFDAHRGVLGVTLTDCVFGHQGVRMVGFGALRMERCEVHYPALVSLRSDYGSSWEGEMVIRDCCLRPIWPCNYLRIISGTNTGLHDFGYECMLPSRIEIYNLHIDNTVVTSNVTPCVFGSFGRDADKEGLLPFRAEGELILDNVSIQDGRPLRISDNPKLFEGYKVTWPDGKGHPEATCKPAP